MCVLILTSDFKASQVLEDGTIAPMISRSFEDVQQVIVESNTIVQRPVSHLVKMVRSRFAFFRLAKFSTARSISTSDRLASSKLV